MRKNTLFNLSRISFKISRLLKKPGLILIVAFFASPIGPHLLVIYEWTGPTPKAFGDRRFTKCTYLGSRGFVDAPLTPNCPWFAFLDTRELKQGQE